MSLSSAWKTNNFTYEPFLPGDIDNVPILDIVRGNIILAQLDGSGNISNNPTPFFILTTSKINNSNNFPNIPATAYQQFMLVQGNSKNFGPTTGSVPNGQNDSNFYFTPFVSQVIDLVPLYAIYNSYKGGIEFFRADIFIDGLFDYKFKTFMTANPDFRPNINSLPNPLGKNEKEFVYLCSSHFYNPYESNSGPYIYSIFFTIADIASNPVTNNKYIYLRTTYKFNQLKSTSLIKTGVKYTPINVYPNGIATFTNFLTSLGGTVIGGSSNNTNISMGFENSNVFYQNDIQNYIGTYYGTDEPDTPYWFANWSIDELWYNYDANVVAMGTTNFMTFQFIPLTYLINPGPGRVPTAPSYLNLTYPLFFGPPQPYPSPLPNVNGINYVAPSSVQGAITNWYGNITSVACSTKVISNSFCGFTPQYYYNSLQGEFYKVEDNPICGATFDPPADTTDVGAGTVAGFSKSCGNTAACVPNFIYDLEVDITQTPFICGPNGAKFDSADYYGMTYNNFYNYFFILPPNGIPYSLTSFTPQPYIDTEKISQNSEGTPKTTFWNSSVFILLAVIFFVLILGFIVYYIYKQNTKKNPFPKYLNKYYT